MNLKNSGDSTGFEPMTSAMPVQCSNQLSYEVTQLRAGQFVGHLNFSDSRDDCLNCPASARIISSFDTYITTADEEISTIECSLNSDLIAVHNWLKTNKLSCNTSKTSYMTIGSRQNLANAKFMNIELDDRPY